MAVKKKTKQRKQHKEAKRQRAQLERLSEKEARRLVEELLVQGKPREALQALQQLPFGELPDFLLLKAEAYGWRARQLQQKGLGKEAAAVLDLLEKQLASLPAVACERIARMIAATPAAFGIRYYKQHREQHPHCPSLEAVVANLLMTSDQWDLLAELPADDVVHRDGQLMARAAADFAQARWQDGLGLLEALPRKSPFASWKLFAKAMLSASQGQEDDLQRALKRLPPNFPLHKTVDVLRQRGCAGLAELREQACQPSQAATQALLAGIRSGDDDLPERIEQWARERFPQYGDMAVRCASELAALLLIREGFDIEEVEEFLPAQFAEPISLRLEMFFRTASDPDAQPFCMALSYLEVVDQDFAGVVDGDLLQAAVYFSLLSRHLASPPMPGYALAHERACLQEWLADQPVAERDLLVAAADKILRLAPEVPAYHRLLNEFNLRELSREGRQLLEKALTGIRNRFSEDPFPYVQLARLYWSQNAHRKAQKTLEEAWQQAPYDPQVREYYCLGLLRAAVMARRRRAYHLTRKDLNAAFELGVKDLLPLACAVQATTDYLQSGDGEAAADALLALPDPVLQYRAAICFYLDLLASGGTAGSMAQKVKTKLHKQLRKNLPNLTSAELLVILAPLNDVYSGFFRPFNPVAFFSSLSPKIVAKLDDREVLMVYAQLLGAESEEIQIKWVRKDLEDRLRKAPDNVFLRFYEVLIHFLLHRYQGPDRFEALLHGLDREETEALREFCRKIAPHFRDPLRTALNFLDFNVLVEQEPWRKPIFKYEDEEDESQDFDEFDMFDELEMVDPLENMVEMFQAMGGDTEAMEVFFEMLAAMIAEEGASEDRVRELGFMLRERAPQLVQKLRRIYSGRNARRLGRVGRLVLFPERD